MTFVRVDKPDRLTVRSVVKDVIIHVPLTAGGLEQRQEDADFFIIEFLRRATPSGLVGEVVENNAGSFSAWVAAHDRAQEVAAGDVAALRGTVEEEGQYPWIPSAPYSDPAITTLVQLLDDNPAPARLAKYASIDQRTQEIIAAGFDFTQSSVTTRHSLSQNAQTTYLGMYTARDLLSYPVEVNTLDDSGVVSLADEAAVAAFYAAGIAHVRSVLDAGTALKAQVTAATTEQAVYDISDDR